MSSHAQQKKNAKATYYYFNMHHVLFFSGKTFQNVTFNKVMADCNTSVEFEVIVYRNWKPFAFKVAMSEYFCVTLKSIREENKFFDLSLDPGNRGFTL